MEESSVELIFVPVPGLTHLVSSMEFAKLLIGRDDRIRITVLIIKPLEFVSELSDYTRSVSDSEPKVRFVDLPEIEPPPLSILARSAESFFTLAIESYAPVVRDAISEILAATRPDSVRVAGLVLDFFCVPMIDVGDEFGLRSYIFLTTNAAFLNLMLYLPNRGGESELSESGPELAIPGFANSVPPMVLPSGLFNRNGGYEAFLKLARRFRDARGIIVNSFSELEGHAFGCLCDGEFRGRNRNPPVYAVGPVLDLEARAHRVADRASHEEIVEWLDEQPPASVVFLCFGSMGGFGGPQMKEIALALERGGFRFLWTIHEPPVATDVLPKGFMERIGGRGMICKWAPQTEVLAHVAIGGFVSHCGWNSVLESLWSGVPIATWPLYAEQQLNAFMMVKELRGLAVEMRLGSRSGGDLVPADEIERAVRRLMDGDGEVENKVKEMGIIARKALINGGSSFASIGRLMEDMLNRDSL